MVDETENASPRLETWLWKELGIDLTDGWRDLDPITEE